MKTKMQALSPDLLNQMDAYWRAANYLSVGQIYLYDNPLLKKPLAGAHQAASARSLGDDAGTELHLRSPQPHHQGIRSQRHQYYRAGPWWTGAGGQCLSRRNLQRGVPRHLARRGRVEAAVYPVLLSRRYPEPCCTGNPGSIHEGGELGYSLSHAFGAAFDNPGLLVACVVGDGEAETGPLATSWHSNKFLNPVHDGAVLPICT
jgi:xylulose-5-phosphate/fructose-6-phosphate phosphoketolase